MRESTPERNLTIVKPVESVLLAKEIYTNTIESILERNLIIVGFATKVSLVVGV